MVRKRPASFPFITEQYHAFGTNNSSGQIFLFSTLEVKRTAKCQGFPTTYHLEIMELVLEGIVHSTACFPSAWEISKDGVPPALRKYILGVNYFEGVTFFSFSCIVIDETKENFNSYRTKFYLLNFMLGLFQLG